MVKVFIIDTGAVKNLHHIDPETGVDHIVEFISDDLPYCEIADMYSCTDEEYEQWLRILDAHQTLQIWD